MEDRRTPGLYLETTDRPVSHYAETRVPLLLDRIGVARATWWVNVVPHRTDLPRVLPEFETLGVFEVDDGFEPPPLEPDLTGYHFRCTGRPGQGRLTGRPTLGLSLVLISPREPDQAQALRDWADFVHLRHIAEAAVPGFTMVTPYENVTGGDPRFLHFYELDTDDPEPAFQSMTPMVSARIGEPGTDAWNEWAMTPELKIWYVNTFLRVGEKDRRLGAQPA